MTKNPMLEDQSGGASLIAVSFTSLLITVIVLAMATLMVGELRQATDAESSIKSYYQAESAAEEASAYLANRLINGSITTSRDALNQDCLAPTPSQFTSADPAIAASITCARILVGGKLPPMSLRLNDPREQVKEFDLSGLNFDTVDIAWGIDQSNQVPSGGEPLLEITMTNYANPSSDADTSISTLILDPTNPANVCPPPTDPCAPFSSFYYPPAAGSEPTTADLTPRLSKPPSGLPLRAVISRGTPIPALSAGYNSVLRIRTRKNSAIFQLKLWQGGVGGAEVTAIPLNNAIIDITTQVGSSYRRIQREVPIIPNPFPGLSDVIYSDTSICKDFVLLTTPGGFEQAYSGTCPINP